MSVSQCPQCHAAVEAEANFCGDCRFDLRRARVSTTTTGQGSVITPAMGPPASRPTGASQFLKSNGGIPSVTSPAMIRSRTTTGRPQRFLGIGPWLFDAVLKQPRSVLCSIGFIWLFNIPLAVLFGFLGLIGGGVVGGFGGGVSLFARIPGVSTYVDLFSSEIGGFIGAALGAVLGMLAGAVQGLILPFELASGGDPIDVLVFVVGQFLIAMVIGLVYTAFQVAFEGRRFQFAGARQPSRRERELLLPILESCAASLEMAGRPRLLMDDSLEVNAYAGTSHIVVNVGVLEGFSVPGGADRRSSDARIDPLVHG